MDFLANTTMNLTAPTINLVASTKVDVSVDLEVSNDLNVIGRTVNSTVTAIDGDDGTDINATVGDIFVVTFDSAEAKTCGTGGAYDCLISNGIAGQKITIVCDSLAGGGSFTITDANNCVLAGNLAMTTGDSITLIFIGTNWYEVSRSVN